MYVFNTCNIICYNTIEIEIFFYGGKNQHVYHCNMKSLIFQLHSLQSIFEIINVMKVLT